MTTIDKAVSTEDLRENEIDQALSLSLSIARLEAILQTLVDNKVESLKNENTKNSSVHSSPKSILNRLRLTSTSSENRRIVEEQQPNKKQRIQNKSDHYIVDIRNKQDRISNKEVSTSVIQESSYRCRVTNFDGSSNSEDERHKQYHSIYIDDNYSLHRKHPPCCCSRDIRSPIMHLDDDYISLKIDGVYGDVETDVMINEKALRNARRKRKRKRKRRMNKRLAMHHAHIVNPIEVSESYKNLSDSELSRRAKWTIVATACLLLFMCMLLVGITLRMAPIIDEMVRKENEEFLNSLNRKRNTTVPSVHKSIT